MGVDVTRILIVSTNKWPSAGQLALALVRVGFQVAVICPANSPVQLIKNIHAHFYYQSWKSLTSIKSAIAEWEPNLLICTDDIALHELHKLHFKSSKRIDKKYNKQFVELIEHSIGDKSTFATTKSKSELTLLARSIGIRCPYTTVVDNNYTLKQEIENIVYPVMVKADGSWGGRGVRPANNRNELLSAIPELSLPFNWPNPLKRLIARTLQGFFFRWNAGWPHKMSVQQSLVGRPANRAVVCWRGKIIAGVSMEAVATSSKFGPTTIGKIINHSEIAVSAETIVAKLSLSGFIGFDFVIDHDNRAWLLEMNARATPTCHLCTAIPSLPGSLFTELTGTKPKAEVRLLQQDTVAIFPAEPQQAWGCGTDIPHEEPGFVNACPKFETTKPRESFGRDRQEGTLESPVSASFGARKVRRLV